MITLVKDTISKSDLSKLQEWLGTNPRLTKGILTEEFEDKWSRWLGVKYSTFVNSGSSANFLMFDALINSGRLKSNKIIVPAVSWVTTVSPVIQLGLTPILCDCNLENLGLDLNNFEDILKKENIGAVIIVHVLGVPNNMQEILNLCSKYDVILLEDCCEAHGSQYDGIKVGNFGKMSSFSFYYGHHMSTIEGGMVCTNDLELNTIVKSIRSHGWARDLPEVKKRGLEEKYNIKPFNSLYTFYLPGYNFRPTDLNAFLGIIQLENLDSNIKKRNNNFQLYKSKLNQFWQQKNERAYISNFAYGIIDSKREKLVQKLYDNNVECRPLICGSIGRQPFWISRYGISHFPNADQVNDNGFYVPNNQDIKEEEIDFICSIISEKIID